MVQAITNPYQRHVAKLVAAKEILVDERITPLVTWLNNTFDSLNTYASCEGDTKNKVRRRPYILFHTPFLEDVQHLVRMMIGYGSTEINMLDIGQIPTMCFTLKFDSQYRLKRFIKNFCSLTRKQIKHMMRFTFTKEIYERRK